MDTSVRWLNDYLDPPATAEEQADLLTRAGFPLEGTEPVDDDVRQDFEMTSNRGDCVCHVGLAREVAAISGRSLKIPVAAPAAAGPPAAGQIAIRNHETERCPIYTGRVIRGVTVKPSPEWLQQRLRARGDIPRNNVVDATNFVLFELGQPTHVFDMAKLNGGEINIRLARAGEAFLPIGEDAQPVELTADDLVIADAESAVALAGVKGGGLSAVTESTTDILLEAATFDPVSVRNSSRRHQIASESSYRFERGVHPAQVNPAADRLAELILEIAGGELSEGVVADGAPIPERRQVSMRTDRCRKLLGMPIDDAQMLDALERLGFEPRLEGDRIHGTVPVFRLDVEREVDLIEEVSRMHGHDRIPIADSIRVTIAPPQPEELASRAVNDTLVGMGYVQAITHSFVSEDAARSFLVEGQTALRLADQGPTTDAVLRPSVLPSLLRVRAHNRAQGVHRLQVYESAATFWRDAEGHHERVRLALLADALDPGDGLRPLRGVVERLATLLRGPGTTVTVTADASRPWLQPGAALAIGDVPIGVMGLIAAPVLGQFDLEDPLLAAELELTPFYSVFPPETEAHALPSFPAIERDVSAIVDEQVAWADIRAAIDTLSLPMIETVEFITTFRGRQIGEHRKSVTLRCRFRAADRTLTHGEVDPQIDRVIDTLSERFQAEIRR